VYYCPALAAFGVVAPGKTYLGYFGTAKEAAICFSRHVAVVTEVLGRRYA
jgi:hypothetical protein